MEIPEAVTTQCEANFSDPEEVAMCQRGAMAGQSVGFLFQDLKSETSPPLFSTPDPGQVGRTNDQHPGTQCRLDTYFQGAACVAEIPGELNDGLDDSDPTAGTCFRTEHESGLRPLCWYKPS